MDFFKPGSVEIMMFGPNGEQIDLDGFPNFLTNSDGETELCDCPPGVCLGESETFNGATSALFAALLDGPADDEFDDDEDFEPLSPEDKIEAVAQLGRIAEDLTVIVGIHANLLKELIAS